MVVCKYPMKQYITFHGRGYKIGPVKMVHGTIVMLKYMDIKTTKTLRPISTIFIIY